MYRTGDYVYPTDLPRRGLCRVEEVEKIRGRGGTFQILKLKPLESPWDPSARLVGFDEGVHLAQAGEVWQRREIRRHSPSANDAAYSGAEQPMAG